MMTPIKTEKLILYTILALVLLNGTFSRCSNTNNTLNQPKITIVRDTVWQSKIDTFNVQTLTYKTVYVSKEDSNRIETQLPKTSDSSFFTKAKVYKDTLSNDDIDIYSYNLLDGNLLDSNIAYKLKVPREITITKTIEHPKTYRSGLYVFSEVGGNTNTFNNLSLGLQYNRKGKWFVSYRANLNSLEQPTHHLGVGFRLIK